MKRKLPVAIVVVFLGALSTFWFLRSSPPTTVSVEPSSSSPAGIPAAQVRRGAEPPHALGDIYAPVFLEEFGDFECSPCRSLHPVLKNLKAEFGTQLVIVFRQFPIGNSHKHALAAARASEAAALQGRFWEMHHLLYDSQDQWKIANDTGPIFESYASKIGLGMDQYRRDVSSEAVEKRIALDRERAQWIGVNGTPTVFLNGREVPPDFLTLERLRGLVSAQVAFEK